MKYTGDNSFGGENYWAKADDPITFYAVNSWNDILFQQPDKNDDYYGTMYCTEDYSESCSIAEKGPWECTDSSSICQNPPTYAPIATSDNPTTDPTINPITLSPSIAPSSLKPTNAPNIRTIPTINPTKTTTQGRNGDSAENKPKTTKSNATTIDINNNIDDDNNLKDFISKYSHYIPFIAIALSLCCLCICFEACYCYRKRKRKEKYEKAAKTRYTMYF